MKTKDKGHALQFLGLLTLLAGTRGFFILNGDYARYFFHGLVVSAIFFAICLSVGGSMVKRGKMEEGE
jgi:hypothetical protein